MESLSPRHSRKSLVRALVLSLGIVTALALLWKVLPVAAWTRAALGAIAEFGILAPVVFGLVYLLASLLGVPRTPLNIGAGVLFSFPVAMATVLASATATFVASFLIARHAASEWVEERVRSIPNAGRIMEAVEEEGFKLVLLFRMNPFIPAIIKGYGFGTTSIPLGKYLAASVLGFLPIALVHVFLGWAGGAALSGAGGLPPAWRAGILVGGVAVSILLVYFVHWFTQRALDRRNAGAAA